MRGCLLMAAMVAGIGAAAQANGQTGASTGVPLQSGAWGARGWQSDAAMAQTAAAEPAPVPQPARPLPPAQNYQPTGYAPTNYPPLRGDYKPIRPGKKLPGGYADPIYTVVDWRAYGLERPYPGTRWVRYFDDAVLVNPHGRAVYVRYRVAWNAPRAGAGMQAAGGAGYVPPVASTKTVRTGPNTTVTTQVIPPPPAYYGGGYGPDYGWGPGVTVTPSVVTTTTTTRYEPVSRRR